MSERIFARELGESGNGGDDDDDDDEDDENGGTRGEAPSAAPSSDAASALPSASAEAPFMTTFDAFAPSSGAEEFFGAPPSDTQATRPFPQPASHPSRQRLTY